jgi:hypothetical protein
MEAEGTDPYSALNALGSAEAAGLFRQFMKSRGSPVSHSAPVSCFLCQW